MRPIEEVRSDITDLDRRGTVALHMIEVTMGEHRGRTAFLLRIVSELAEHIEALERKQKENG